MIADRWCSRGTRHRHTYAGRWSRRMARGFTLIEVVVALVIIGLAGLGLASFSMQSYRVTQDLTIRATAENLAEVTLEELSSMASSRLYSMTHSAGFVSVNFPENGHVESAQEARDAAAKYNPTSYNSTTNAFAVSDGTYHVLCDGQLLLGAYDSYFDGTGTGGSVGSSGAIVKTLDGSDLFSSAPWNSIVTVTGPSSNDYSSRYSPAQILLLPSDDTSGYGVYKYELGSGIYLEPINNGTTATPAWHTAGLLVFASAAPHLYREVTITDASTATAVGRYQIRIRVIWTFGGTRQVVEITGGKADLQ